MLKILIADDQLIYRETLRVFLQPYGKCVLVEDGAQAVQAFQEALAANDPFQLVLLDIQMPNMDGQEALMQIRKLEKQKHGLSLSSCEYSYVLMQTSLDDPAQLVTAYKEGHCNGYIVKPVDQDELLERLRKNRII
ncbi:MAG: response regulator [Magnetococcus sp. XQGC-1]